MMARNASRRAPVAAPVHIPVLRWGQPYRSLEAIVLPHLATGEPVAEVSQANPGLVARDLNAAGRGRRALEAHSVRDLLAIARRAAELFVSGDLPLGEGTQSPDDYLRQLSGTTGLPESLARRNMDKIRYVLAEMETVLAGLTRGLDLSVLDRGHGVVGGQIVSYRRGTDVLGAILPSNSPGVHALWLPTVALKVALALKPGRQEPWTPYRVAQAFIAAGAPPEAFGFYPTSYAGAGEILQRCGRSLLFGDASTVGPWRGDPRIEIHGPGWSKVVFGADEADRWPAHLDVLASSVADNGGRSCVNASGVWTSSHGREIAEALAERLATIPARALDDPEAQLAAFASREAAERVSAYLDAQLSVPGAEDVTSRFRPQGRIAEAGGCWFVLPTVVYCEDPEHPLAQTELLFPFVAVVETPAGELVSRLGPSLVVTALTSDPAFAAELDRLAQRRAPEPGRHPHLAGGLGPAARGQPLRAPLPPARLPGHGGAGGRGLSFDLGARHLRRARRRVGRSRPWTAEIGRSASPSAPACSPAWGSWRASLARARVLVVTDPGLRAVGYPAFAAQALISAGCEVRIFDDVGENPTTTEVEAGARAAAEHGAELLVAVGGGSALDAAKGINFLAHQRRPDGGLLGLRPRPAPDAAVDRRADHRRHRQRGPVLRADLPGGARAGHDPGRKMACGDRKARFRAVLLDPGAAGDDAAQGGGRRRDRRPVARGRELRHACGARRSPRCYAREAWRLLAGAFDQLSRRPPGEPPTAAGDMLLGAHLAGAAIEASMLGAAHACANPLTAALRHRARRRRRPHAAARGALQRARRPSPLPRSCERAGASELAERVDGAATPGRSARAPRGLRRRAPAPAGARRSGRAGVDRHLQPAAADRGRRPGAV